MNTPIVQTNPAPGSPSADLFACVCGLITSLLTAVLLWFVAVRLHLAIHKLTLWFVIPIGAFLAGLVAASGYYLAYRMVPRRPGRLLAPSVMAAAVGSFLLIHYLTYLTLRTSPAKLGGAVSFLSFLDLSARSTTIRLMHGMYTPRLGNFGYVTTALEVFGFAFGGLAVWAFLRAKSYCDRCSRRLTPKGKHVRYLRSKELQPMVAARTGALRQGDVAQALQQHKEHGRLGRYPDTPVRSVCSLFACPHCGLNTAVFELQRPQGRDWVSIPESITPAHTDNPGDISG